MSRRQRLLVLVLLCVSVGVVYYRSRPRPERVDPDELLAQGQAAIQRHDVPEAQRICGRLRESGKAEHAALLQGELYYRGKQFARAEEQLARVDGESPLFPQAATFFGLCRLQQFDLQQAAQLFKRVIEIKPDAVEAHRGLADVYVALGALSSARAEMEVIARLDPTDARPWFFLGDFYADVGLRAEAVAAYEKARAAAPDPAAATRARIGLAESLSKFGDHTRALQVLSELPPDAAAVPPAAVLRAEALSRLGRVGEADQVLAPLLADGSPPPAVLVAAGRVAFDGQKYDRAAALLERAVALVPTDYDANYHLAQAYTRLGRTDDANKRQKRADEIQNDLKQMSKLTDQAGARPWDADLRKQLAELTRRLGKNDIAEKWERAARSCPPQ